MKKTIAANIGVNPYFIKDNLIAQKNYGYEGVENALLLLHAYNMKSLGVNDIGSSDASLLKELVIKIFHSNQH